MQLEHLEEESTGRDEDVESEDPDGINRLLNNSWCALQGPLRMLRWRKSTAIIVVVLSTLSATVH